MGFRNLVTNVLRPSAAPKPRSGVGGHAAKTSAAGPVVAWSGIGQPRWTPRRYEHLAEAGFRKNVIAYRCVMQVAVASSAVPWLLYNDQGEELDRHPLLDLLRHPNPLQDGTAFLESIYAHLEIAGNAYIEAVKPRDGDTPVELYVLRPDRMKVVPGPAGLPQAYQYSVNGQTTTWPADPITGASNILHLKQFHPLDDWYGMAPLEAAQISVDQHNAAAAWNQALLNHGARPSGALVFAPKDGPATLTDDQVNRLREELGQVYQGSRNAGRPLILEGGLDWREMSLSPKDMDWLAGRNVAARDIALAFGVPAQLVGIPDAQTYANMAEARLALYEETVLPLVTRVIAGFDHWLSPMFGNDLCLDFDPDEVSALAARRDLQWNKLQNTNFLTINEKRHAVGYAPIEGGDVLDTGKPPQASPPAHPATAAPQNFAPGPMLAPSAFASPAPVGPNAWSSTGKFNPNHDDLGRFTFGAGGSDDDNGGGDNGDNAPDTAPDSNFPTTGDSGPGIFGLPKRPEMSIPTSDEPRQNPADNTPKAWIGQPNEALRDYIANQEQPNADKVPGYGYGNVNMETNALGRYQFLKGSLVDLGLKNPDGGWRSDTFFYRQYGFDSDQEFLENPAAQEDVMTAYIARQGDLTSNLFHEYGGYHFQGIAGTITVTESGLIAAAHRAGSGNVDDYLDYIHDRGGSDGLTVQQLDEVNPIYGSIETRLREAQRLPYDGIQWPDSISNPRSHPPPPLPPSRGI